MILFAEDADLLHSGAMGYMIKGGYFMWPILFMAILATGVVIDAGGRVLGAGDTSKGLAAVVANVTYGLPNSREHEREADRIGVELGLKDFARLGRGLVRRLRLVRGDLLGRRGEH